MEDMVRPKDDADGKVTATGAAMPYRRDPRTATVSPAQPLWKRVPARGEDGRPLSDFMMLVPRLKTRSKDETLAIVEAIQRVLGLYAHAVVFADLNPKLNLLWVSVKPIPGIMLELAAAINAVVPESRLVAQKPCQ